ncbi:orotidine-5'-phosphate decarboxylase [Kroppenstedtia eburnea]|uniref:Orotidine 5'-phosphate decarboxylase n=1 Tax=Kroppenstedtia eburnea TaxID=714067 RepID=A0A1N7J410_9BACL|nr:orotidine-5'-phosphate decarboxylase [Kroppenstedtia eburnea]QKI82477.1 orotidine-5'-phosphate decarboxylase [Kroppenstedtia eburnea]SIS43986.1 orotidine-5'-phosphate decarboxylase [Kroppenstedtia eburnea]
MIGPSERKAASRAIIALDFPSPLEAEPFLARWGGREKPFVKVGMQLFYAAGPVWVKGLVEAGYPVFLDLKLHDIPHTVAGAVSSLTRLGVRLLTLHASGGRAMMEAAREAVEAASGPEPLRLLAVTQLTSTDQRMMNEELGISGPVRESVLNLAHLARRSGIDGVVCSGEEAAWIKAQVSGELLTVTPGIRLEGQERGDQKRVMTPEAAVRGGADLLVVGRPIIRSADPVATYEAIVEQIQWKERGHHG